MTDTAVVQTPAPAPTRADIAANPLVQSGARWFWWIAGLSLVNTALFHSGSNTNFVIGLGITAVADSLFQNTKPIAFAIDFLVIGFFFLMGLQARKGRLWAFVVGAVVYGLDALLYVRFADWMPVGFHALALFFIIRGAMALRASLADAGVR
jgi:hypothetical protein